jgi:hypothetical protein
MNLNKNKNLKTHFFVSIERVLLIGPFFVLNAISFGADSIILNI